MAKCACCGEDTLEEGNGNFEICSLCNWEDDPIQNSDIYLAGGANYYCLKEHRQVYLMFCGIVERFLTQREADCAKCARYRSGLP